MIDIREIITLAFKSIWRNKVRSSLTMLGIIIGVAAVILLVSIGTGLQRYIARQFDELGANTVAVLPGQVSLEGGFTEGPPNFAGSKLTTEHTREIAQLGGAIEAVAASIELPASVSYKGESKYTTVAGVSEDFSKVRNLKLEDGRQISKSDVELSRKVVILGKGIADDLFGASEPLGREVSIGGERFQVIGLLEEIAGGIGFNVNNFASIPITASQRLFGTNSVQSIAIKARSKEEVQGVIDITERYLSGKLKDDEFSVIDQGSLVGAITQILGVLTVALGGIAAISLIVGGVGIMNIMLVSVTERTREIGLRKAIGAKPNDILLQFLVESVVLSALGGVMGILLGAGGAFILSNFFVAEVSWWSVILAFGVSSIVGVVFGVAPAIRASRLDPIEALRYE
ncbi:MAG: ABC transporter permease [bacterium]|nr:ABC transporter permease [bacterium]